MMPENRNDHKGHFWMLLICFAVMIGGVYFIGRDGIGNWGILLFLLCPLMHVFMMKGMGHGDHKKEDDDERHDH